MSEELVGSNAVDVEMLKTREGVECRVQKPTVAEGERCEIRCLEEENVGDGLAVVAGDAQRD